MATDSKRYTVPTDEDWEPGSNNQVLKNYLGINLEKILRLLKNKS